MLKSMLTLFNCTLLITCCFLSEAKTAVVATADIQDGYASKIMDKLAMHWQPPAETEETRLKVRLSLDAKGVLLQCQTIQASGNPWLDSGPCQIAEQIGKFDAPPYALPLDVYLSFWFTGNSPSIVRAPKPNLTPLTPKENLLAQMPPAPKPNLESKNPKIMPALVVSENQQNPTTVQTSLSSDSKFAQARYGEGHANYFKKLTYELQNKITVPAETKVGTYYTTVRLETDAQGNLHSHKIINPSGDRLLDHFVNKGLDKVKTIPSPPAVLGNSLDVTLTLKRR